MPSADPWIEMCEEYRESLAAKLSRMESLWHGIASDPGAGKEELYRTVHSIAGAAGTFGFHEVGRAALDLEPVLEPACQRAGAPGEAESAAIGEGLERLARAVRATERRG